MFEIVIIFFFFFDLLKILHKDRSLGRVTDFDNGNRVRKGV